jgi:hypothetical protein
VSRCAYYGMIFPYLTKDCFVDTRALKKFDGGVNGDYVVAIFVAFPEQLTEELSFLWGVVEFGMSGSDS